MKKITALALAFSAAGLLTLTALTKTEREQNSSQKSNFQFKRIVSLFVNDAVASQSNEETIERANRLFKNTQKPIFCAGFTRAVALEFGEPVNFNICGSLNGTNSKISTVFSCQALYDNAIVESQLGLKFTESGGVSPMDPNEKELVAYITLKKAEIENTYRSGLIEGRKATDSPQAETSQNNRMQCDENRKRVMEYIKAQRKN